MQSGEGLKPSAEGVRGRFTNGTRAVVDGPFSEPKVKCRPVSDGHDAVELEVGPLCEMSDPGSSEAMEPHVRLRKRRGGQ